MLKFVGARWGETALLASHSMHLSALEKSAFADILSEAAWLHLYLLSTGT